ncbi:hypothetical protein [Bradyrhizobium sp. BRP56]|uniref:hypothetical protein n=1 Tax=Bradyrhizobium sp. BRP56 TaxID=2793819 RepID=UPI001CD468C2|nr:hypothetical protein [Bradyrhizobium sp. BRP56]MCA1399351.1 hypothetical protein [Bradyrhizobium sp. BRP56]
MTYKPLPFPDRYVDRLTVSAPQAFGRAVREAAARQGLSTADFVRLAVAERAVDAGIAVPRLPILSNSTFVPDRIQRRGK